LSLTFSTIESAAKEEVEKVKPTRALSSYIFFANEMIPKLKSEEGIAHKDAMIKTGKLWGELSDDEKKKYNDMHDEDQKR
jgi:hypothetical protein